MEITDNLVKPSVIGVLSLHYYLPLLVNIINGTPLRVSYYYYGS